MSIWYVDPINGNDANYGNTFALRKQKMSGFTTTQLIPGDEIRYIATPANLLGPVTWQDRVRYVYSEVPIPVTHIADCDTAWTAATSVTATVLAGSGAKQGTGCANLNIATAFTTGRVAHFALPAELDLSGHQQITFWIKMSVQKNVGTFTLDLCSDTAGTVPVNSFALPTIPASRWTAITLDYGSALSSTVNSIRLNALVDPATVVVNIDNVMACLAPSDPACVTLNSVIGKNTQSETFYGIQGITGQTITLDNDVSTGANQSSLYYGVTETVPTYIVNPIRVPITSGVYTSAIEAGQDGYPYQISGGWDPVDMSTQIGETWFDGQNGSGTGMSTNTWSYLTFDKFGFVRFDIGFRVENGTLNTNIGRIHCNNNPSMGFSGQQGPKGLTVNELFTMNGRVVGTDLSTGCGTVINNLYSHGNQGNSTVNANIISTTSASVVINNCSSKGAGNAGIRMGTGVTLKNANITDNIYGIKLENGCTIYGLTANLARNSSGSFDCSNVMSGTVYTKDFTSTDTALTYLSMPANNTRILQQNANGVQGYHRIAFGGSSNIETTTEATYRHTQSGVAWKFNLTTTTLESNPLWISAAKVYCVAGKKATVSVWAWRNSPTVVGLMHLEGNQLAGVPITMKSPWHDKTEGQWGQLVLEFTPTETGIVEIQFKGYTIQNQAGTLAFDDFNFVQES